MKVRECGTHVRVEFSDTRFVRRCARLRCVVDEIVGEQFLENIEIPLPLDLFGISADNCFSGFG
jgi:hypothetical protein